MKGGVGRRDAATDRAWHQHVVDLVTDAVIFSGAQGQPKFTFTVHADQHGDGDQAGDAAAASFSVIQAKDSSVEGYVPEQALDGLFEIIAQQEASIRQNPAEAATTLAKKVFGAL